MSESQPNRRLERQTVGVGIVAGFLLNPVVTLVAGSVVQVDSLWALLLLLLLPALCVPFLLWSRTRLAGAGCLIGVAVGAVVFAGTCSGLLLLFSQAG